MDLDLWRLIDAQHAVVMEIGLLDPSPVDGDLAIECRGQAENQSAFQLGHNGIRIDRYAGVNGRCGSPQMDFTVLINFRFHHGRNEAAERRLYAHAAPDACRQRLAPI